MLYSDQDGGAISVLYVYCSQPHTFFKKSHNLQDIFKLVVAGLLKSGPRRFVPKVEMFRTQR